MAVPAEFAGQMAAERLIGNVGRNKWYREEEKHHASSMDGPHRDGGDRFRRFGHVAMLERDCLWTGIRNRTAKTDVRMMVFAGVARTPTL